jgi:glycine/sarcosine N-methyltransferase
MSTPLYDSFSVNYDRFVNWEERLRYELPFIEEQLAGVGARRLLDAACGTGMHAIALAQQGYRVIGADASAGMIQRARANAAGLECDVSFKVAGLGELAPQVADSLDAVLCLGNSLPHLLTTDALNAALNDFHRLLRRGGLLIIQNRNFDRVIQDDNGRWMEPQTYREDGREWLFVRFYDIRQDGTLSFNLVTLSRCEPGGWEQQVDSTLLRPWLRSELESLVALAGFHDAEFYGDMSGTSFDPQSSGNLVITAKRG